MHVWSINPLQTFFFNYFKFFFYGWLFHKWLLWWEADVCMRHVCVEIRISPTKPCGKGNKRKQDELDEDEEEPEQQTWVDALTQELADNEGSDEDPDYQVAV